MCRYISNNFVWKTMIILKRRAANSKEIFNRQPLTILVNGTRITRNILDSVGYKRNSDLLKLLFHNSNTQLSVILKLKIIKVIVVVSVVENRIKVTQMKCVVKCLKSTAT
ncbi:unnamed protein product [Ceratitis capitata]|uniref:(Mediterranean fruit fly) hypothetical protein n=1 Tax=Ceratitis capitata TaxID=7213 RepID=A0A811V7U6_CERCA|nr:unnamed protein product [Ceratitis capitata]